MYNKNIEHQESSLLSCINYQYYQQSSLQLPTNIRRRENLVTKI